MHGLEHETGLEMTKQATLADIFTASELERAKELFLETPVGSFNKVVVAEIIEPVMDRINKALGQENDPRYMGYMLEHALTQSGLEPGSKAPAGPKH